MKKIKNALVSVFDKDGLQDIVRELDKLGITIDSTEIGRASCRERV